MIPVVRGLFYAARNSTDSFVVTEIAIEKCYVDPQFVTGMCEPPSTTEDDAIKGKWVRVGPDLNAGTSMSYLVSLSTQGPRNPPQ